MFHIVVFDKTNEVEVVPSIWIKNGECLWPPNKTDIAKAVRLQDCPGDEWKAHKARIIFTSHDYNEARRKLPQAVEQTDVGSDEGNSPRAFKRKRMPKNNLLPGEDDSETESIVKEKKSKKGKYSLPNAPKIIKQHKTLAVNPVKENSPGFNPTGRITAVCHYEDMEGSLEGTKSQNRNFSLPNARSIARQDNTNELEPGKQSSPKLQVLNQTTPSHHLKGHIASYDYERGHSSPELFPSDDSTPELYLKGHSTPKLYSRGCSSPNLYSGGHSSDHFYPRGHNSQKLHTSQHHGTNKSSSRHNSNEIHTSSTEVARPSHVGSKIHRSSHVSAKIHGQSHSAPSTVTSKHTEPPQTREQTSNLQTSLLRNILTKQEMMMDQLRIIFKTLQSMKPTEEAEAVLDRNLLPIKDVGSLEDIEEQLRSNPDLQKQLVNKLALKGGVDLHECIWRIMHGLMTNSLARKINMRGINGKIGFQSLHLRNVVIAAVRRNRLTSEASEKDIDSTIKRWLYLAPDRDGGRKERQKRKENQEKTC